MATGDIGTHNYVYLIDIVQQHWNGAVYILTLTKYIRKLRRSNIVTLFTYSIFFYKSLVQRNNDNHMYRKSWVRRL